MQKQSVHFLNYIGKTDKIKITIIYIRIDNLKRGGFRKRLLFTSLIINQYY